jgi:hypothetical protein
MIDAVDPVSRSDDIDQRLVSPKTLDLSEEMATRAPDAERRIAYETAHKQLRDEWIKSSTLHFAMQVWRRSLEGPSVT